MSSSRALVRTRQTVLDRIADAALEDEMQADADRTESERAAQQLRARQGNILGELVGEEQSRLDDVAELEKKVREAVTIVDRLLQRGVRINDLAGQLGYSGLTSGLCRPSFARRLSRMLGVALSGLDGPRRFGLLDPLPTNFNLRAIPWREQEAREMAGNIERIERNSK